MYMACLFKIDIRSVTGSASLYVTWRIAPEKSALRRSRAKPAWVKREALRLAALTGDGCRAIEKLFNRLHAARQYDCRQVLCELHHPRQSLRNRNAAP